MHRIKFWKNTSSGDQLPEQENLNVNDVSYTFQAGDHRTLVLSNYHLCRYDPILSTLICVSDECDVMVMGKNMCKHFLPVNRKTHWIDCQPFTGTTSFLILSPEALVCMDYGAATPASDDSFIPYGKRGNEFTALHVPQGLTSGAIGRKNGCVSYFCFEPSRQYPQKPRLLLATVETDLLPFIRPYCDSFAELLSPDNVALKATNSVRYMCTGSVVSIDSYPSDPNALIGVVLGAPGVCKWYVNENRLSCFFLVPPSCRASEDSRLATCRVTPGGAYVAATTEHVTKIFIWNEKNKKKDKSAELYWKIELGNIIPDAPLSAEPFESNEHKVSLHMARAAADNTVFAVSDKNCRMYVLLQGQHEVFEMIIRLDEKQLLQNERILPPVKKGGNTTDNGAAYPTIFQLEPCTFSNYWTGAWTEDDFNMFIVSSSEYLHPWLIRRDRQSRGIEDISELREMSPTASWVPHAILFRLPEPQLKSLAIKITNTPPTRSWGKVLTGGKTCLEKITVPPVASKQGDEGVPDNESKWWSRMAMISVTDAPAALCVSPGTKETFPIHSSVLNNSVPWMTLQALTPEGDLLLCEEGFPALETCSVATEIILRVLSSPETITALKIDLRRSSGSLIWELERRDFDWEIENVASAVAKGEEEGGKNENDDKNRMAKSVKVVDVRLALEENSGRILLQSGGKALLILLANSTVALVDLGGAKDDNGKPLMVLVSPALLPHGSAVESCDVFKYTGSSGGLMVYLIVLLADGRGYAVLDLSYMRLVTYEPTSPVRDAHRLLVTQDEDMSLPNLPGDVNTFEVQLHVTEAPICAGVYGEISCCDAIGSRLFFLRIGYGLAMDGMNGSSLHRWCVLQNTATDWTCMRIDEKESSLRFIFNAGDSVLRWCVENDPNVTLHTGIPSALPGTITNVDVAWGVGKAELRYTDTAGTAVNTFCLDDEAAYNVSGGAIHSTPISPSASLSHVAFISDVSIKIFPVTQLMPLDVTISYLSADTTPLFTCAPHYYIEKVMKTLQRGLLVVARDVNGWRWIYLFHSTAAIPCMKPIPTVDFATEESIHPLTVLLHNTIHLYLLGNTDGVMGHFTFHRIPLSDTIHSSTNSCDGAVGACFSGKPFRPTPPTFRGYSQFLPPAPTQKQEQGFFTRLLTLPWEDIAAAMEKNFAQGRQHRPIPVKEEESHTKSQMKKKEEEKINVGLFKSSQGEMHTGEEDIGAGGGGARYRRLKAFAEKEKVSLSEAQRIMNENVRRIHERGERINAIENASTELAQQAQSFESLAKQLKEKYKGGF